LPETLVLANGGNFTPKVFSQKSGDVFVAAVSWEKIIGRKTQHSQTFVFVFAVQRWAPRTAR
jgi:hypothetical protein